MGEKLAVIEILCFTNWLYDVYDGDLSEPRENMLNAYWAWKRKQEAPDEGEGIAKVYSFQQAARRSNLTLVRPISTDPA